MKKSNLYWLLGAALFAGACKKTETPAMPAETPAAMESAPATTDQPAAAPEAAPAETAPAEKK